VPSAESVGLSLRRYILPWVLTGASTLPCPNISSLEARGPRGSRQAVFDIVNHLNRGAALITAQDQREHVAELNPIAGKRARAAAAYASALATLQAPSLAGTHPPRRGDTIMGDAG
jgi:hypothetical protein